MRDLDWGPEERRVYHQLRDSEQKVLTMKYESENLTECHLSIQEP